MADDQAPSPWIHEFRKASGLAPGMSATPRFGRERRRDPRFLLFNAPTILTKRGAGLFGLGCKNAPAQAVDLSEGGVQIAAGLEVAEGSPVEVRIELPRFKDALLADGVVAWCRADQKDSSRYRIGIRFVGLDPSVPKRIGHIRGWFTSDYCSEFREQKPPSAKSIAVPADLRNGRSLDPLSAGGVELEPGIWAVTVKGSLEGADLEPLEIAVGHALRQGAAGLLVDLGGARARSAKGLDPFLSLVDKLGQRGVRILFVAVPPGLKELFDQRTDRKRNFVPNLALGRSLLAAGMGKSKGEG